MKYPKLVVSALACAMALQIAPFAGETPAAPVIPEIPPVSAEATAPARPRTTDWQLLLVNPHHLLPEGYSPEIARLPGGHGVDRRAYNDLVTMLDDCRKAGFQPRIRSSYRSLATQKFLYNRKVGQMKALGYKGQAAYDRAAEIVAFPGTSEHQLGLALDIVDAGFQILDDRQEKWPAQQWLLQHSWEYGFTLRYPKDKVDITEIIYEPWHYRYVGKQAAAEMFAEKLCLEEYLDKLTFIESMPEAIARKSEDAARQVHRLLTADERLPELLPGLPPHTGEVLTDPLAPTVSAPETAVPQP